MDPQEFQKAWSKVVAKAWSDELFKKRLLADPKTVLKKHGIEVPETTTVKVVENSDTAVTLILPPPPAEELTEDELKQVAAGRRFLSIWM